MHQGKALETILQKKGVTKKDFADAIGVTRQAVNNYTRTQLFHSGVLSTILSELHMDLEEFNKVAEDSTLELSEPITDYKSTFSFYTTSATMTVTENWPDHETAPSFQVHLPGFEGCIAVQSFGDSMYPTFVSGCWVLCKEIVDKDVIKYGECHLIMTADHLMIKRLLKSNNEEFVTLSSDNYHAKDEDRKRYAPIEMPKAKILKLWIIRGALKKFEI